MQYNTVSFNELRNGVLFQINRKLDSVFVEVSSEQTVLPETFLMAYT